MATAPLILTGLSVAFAFRVGLFNIGAQGQYTVGAVIAVWVAHLVHAHESGAAHRPGDRRWRH